MLELLSRTLAEAGLSTALDDLQDVLWLAVRLPLSATSKPIGASSPNTDSSLGQKFHTSKESDSDFGNTPESGEIDLHANTGNGSIPAGASLFPGLSVVPSSPKLRRALQPLRRRVTSKSVTVLDEETTAERQAETGIKDPAWQGVRERWFDLYLIIDTSPTMCLWDYEIENFVKNLKSNAGFRSLRRLRLGGSDTTVLIQFDNETTLKPSAVAPVGARPLVLVVTDGGAQRWANGTGQRWLWEMGAVAPVTLLHLLPWRAWRHGHFGQPLGQVWWSGTGQSNSKLHSSLDELEIPSSAWRAVPIMEFNADSLTTWARVAVASRGASISAIWVNSKPSSNEQEQKTRHGSPERQIAEYRHRVSLFAYELTFFLSVPNPLTMKVMRLVQKAMLPQSSTADLSEFLQGGLLKVKYSVVGDMIWQLPDELRRVFLRSLRYSEEDQINEQLRQVGALLEHSDRHGETFEAYFPNNDGKHHIADDQYPFAKIKSDVSKPVAPDSIHVDSDFPVGQAVPSKSVYLEQQVYVSYAHADNEPLDMGMPGWVSFFVDKLRRTVARQSGCAQIEFWMDHRLDMQRRVNDELRQRLCASAVILAVISPRYFESAWCQLEMKTFVEEVGGGLSDDRVFMVELLPTERMLWPSQMQHLQVVKFWKGDLTHPQPMTLGWPLPDARGDRDYWDKVNTLATGIARQLRALAISPQPVPAVTPATQPIGKSDTSPIDGPLSIIICTDYSDIQIALEAQALLGDLDVDAFLDTPPAENEPPATYRANFEQQLRSSHGVIVVYGEAPRGWLQSKFGDVRKLLALERQGTWVGVLEGPPEPKALHGLPPRGLMVLNCRQGISKDELSRFVQALRNGQNGAGANGAGRV